jgi:N-acetylglucosamine kinase-like BadF-type ATPase
MIIIADGGSTKCDWAVVDKRNSKIIERFKTEGINPFAVSIEKIREVLHTHFAPVASKYDITNIWFYGSGCVFATVDKVKTLLAEIVPGADIFVGTDLDGAVNACCPDGNGIACIIGTGSSSAQHEGGVRTKQVPALGYLLGDEGSGTVMGRLILSDFLKGVMPAHLTKAFAEEYGVTQAEALERAYHQPAANRYFGSFAPFLSKYLQDPYIQGFVKDNLRRFVVRNVCQYRTDCYPANFVGSIASVFEPLLSEVLAEEGVRKGIITSSPMELLVKYHSK